MPPKPSSTITTRRSSPSIDPLDFQYACGWLQTAFEATSIQDHETDWLSVTWQRKDDQGYLRIDRKLHLAQRWDPEQAGAPAEDLADGIDSEDIDELHPSDHEELLRHPFHSSTPGLNDAFVEYHIFRSPVYCVPTLYFFLRRLPLPVPSTIDTAYEVVVPKAMKERLSHVGVVGAISSCNHPLTDEPAFFIHPCQTADGMRPLGHSKGLSPERYLMLWFGLIGASVGLYIPAAIAQCISSSD